MKIAMIPMLLAGFGLVVVAGCGEGKPSCELLYKRLDKCDKMPLKKDVFMEMCNKKKDEHSEEIACSAKKGCDDFKKCMEDARKAASAKRAQKRFDEAMGKNDLKDAMMICDIHKDNLSEDLKKKCGELGPKAFDDFMKKATELRKTADKQDYGLCFELKDLGKKLGADKEKAAELICKEIDLQVTLKKATTEIDKRITEKQDSLPFYCMESTLKKFDEVATDFAKEKKKELINACFIKMGKAILEKQVPEMKGFCRYSVKEIYKAVKQYELKDESIDALITQAAPLCDK